MNGGKLLLIAGGVGLLTMLVGWALMHTFGVENVRSTLIPLFITGVAIFFIMEFSGAHKAFCNTI